MQYQNENPAIICRKLCSRHINSYCIFDVTLIAVLLSYYVYLVLWCNFRSLLAIYLIILYLFQVMSTRKSLLIIFFLLNYYNYRVKIVSNKKYTGVSRGKCCEICMTSLKSAIMMFSPLGRDASISHQFFFCYC